MSRPRRMAASAGLLAAMACSGYRTVADPSRFLTESPSPVGEVLVTLKGNQRVTFLAPEVVGDSLRGTLEDGARWQVALADVTRVEVPTSTSQASYPTLAERVGSGVAAAVICVAVLIIFRPESCTVEDEEAVE